MENRIRQRKAERRGAKARPLSVTSNIDTGLDDELGFAEMHAALDEGEAKRSSVVLSSDEMDERFRRVMMDEERRQKERAAATLALKPKRSDLEVQVDNP